MAKILHARVSQGTSAMDGRTTTMPVARPLLKCGGLQMSYSLAQEPELTHYGT